MIRVAGAVAHDRRDQRRAAEALSALVRKDRFSVFVELNTTTLSGRAGVRGRGRVDDRNAFRKLGDAAILSALTLTFCFSIYYCFSRGLPYSDRRVESSGFAFDYVLYLGCLVLAIELGYVESRFHILQTGSDNYLLLSAVVFFTLAYRFDNRFVLSLALSTLAGWFSLRLSGFPDVVGPSLRTTGLLYGALVAMAGTGLYKAGIKKHFLETYLHVAANVLFIALLSALFDRHVDLLYLAGLLGLAGVAIALGVRFKRFAFVVYGVGYGYIGTSARVLHGIDSFHRGARLRCGFQHRRDRDAGRVARRFGREE